MENYESKSWVVFSISGFVLTTLPTLDQHPSNWDMTSLNYILGVSLVLFGMAGVIISTYIMIRYSSKIEVMILAGPYRVVRHPIYLSGIIWDIGIILLTILPFKFSNLIMGIFGIVCFVIAAKLEEDFNLYKFGRSYRKYMTEVTAFNFWRGLKKLHSGD